MTAALILDCERQGVRLYLSGDQLRARVQSGSATESVRSAIDRHRAEIVAALEVIEGTVANVQAEPPEVRDAWQREIVAALRWVELGNAPDPFLDLDLAALRRFVPVGACLDCGGPAPADGRHWCAACERMPDAKTAENGAIGGADGPETRSFRTVSHCFRDVFADPFGGIGQE